MDSEKQMQFLFEEGGMTDDGMNRDPISGNEVPPGSLAEEVRDDIPAQLSEGEYVVPADVVRYYGVKFFEDLRADAKTGLTQMQQDGRIGGEPVMMNEEGAMSADMGLSPEEEAELQMIIGAAEGGFISEATMLSNNVDYETRQAFQEGGDVTQINPDFSQFGAGFSFMGAGAGQTPAVVNQRNVTLYGPNGEVVNLILPTDQARYDELMGQGYSETPVAQASTPQAEQQSGSDTDEIDVPKLSSDLNRGTTGSFDFSPDDLDALDADPLSWGAEQLQPRNPIARGVVGIMGMANPIMGLLGGGMMTAAEVSQIARTRAAINIARSRGLDTSSLEEQLEEHIANASPATRAAAGQFGTGERYAEEINNAITERQRALQANPEVFELNARRNQRLYEMLQDPRNRNNPGIASLVDDMRTGRAGAGYRDYAVGKISGYGGTPEGVVAYTDANGDVKVVRDANNRTIFRDELGRSYVKTGFFGQNVQYIGDVVDPNGNVVPAQYDPTQQPSVSQTPVVPAPAVQPPASPVATGGGTSRAPTTSPVPQPRPSQPSSGSGGGGGGTAPSKPSSSGGGSKPSSSGTKSSTGSTKSSSGSKSSSSGRKSSGSKSSGGGKSSSSKGKSSVNSGGPGFR